MIFSTPKEKSRFSGYYTKRLIHTGEKSLVMEATRRSDNARVAIKLYMKSYDRTARKLEKKYKIPSEAEIGMMLNPGGEKYKDSRLVATLDSGTEYDERSGARYLVQEFVRGVTLKKLISCKDSRLERNLRSWAGQLCLGLKEMHSKNLIYRDMCSDNVIVCASGRIKLLDLGFVVPENIKFEEKGGTPSYMAPEQVAGMPLCPGTDIYGLGIVLFEMLTGSLPYTAKIPGDHENARNMRRKDLMRQHIEAPPPEVPEKYRDKDPVIAGIIPRCLRKDPRQRYEHIDAVLEALDRNNDIL